MKSGKVSAGWYLIATFGGLVSGLCFSKAMYHKGKIDAFRQTQEELDKLAEGIQDVLDRKEENEEA